MAVKLRERAAACGNNMHWTGMVIDRRGPREAFPRAAVAEDILINLSHAAPVLDEAWVAHATAPLSKPLPEANRIEPEVGQTWWHCMSDGRYAVVRLQGRGVIDDEGHIAHARSPVSAWLGAPSSVWIGEVVDGSAGVELAPFGVSYPLSLSTRSPFPGDFPPFDPATWDPVFDEARLAAYAAAGHAKRSIHTFDYSAGNAGFERALQQESPTMPRTYLEDLNRLHEERPDHLLAPHLDQQRCDATVMLRDRLGVDRGCGDSLYDVLSVRFDAERRGELLTRPLEDDLRAALPLWRVPEDTHGKSSFAQIERDVQAMISGWAIQQAAWQQSDEGRAMRRRRARRVEPGMMERAGEALGELADEGGEAAWNVAAIKAVDWGKATLVGLLSRKLAPGDRALRNKIAKLVATDGGTVAVSFALSGLAAAFGSKVAPALGIDSERLDYLARRLRVMGMTQGGVALVDSFVAELRSKAGPLIAMLQAMPSLPAPRIRDSLRDDPEVAVAEVKQAVAPPAQGEA